MNHLKQTRVNNCGQTCVAMLAGYSIDGIEELMNKKGKTRTSDLCKALYKLGFVTFNKLDRGFDLTRPSPWYILKCTAKNGRKVLWSHWVVYDYAACQVYDPGLERSFDMIEWMELVGHVVTVTSSLKVYPLSR